MADALGLPRIGVGAAPLGNLYQPISDDVAAATLDAAFAAGLGYVDTAPYYGFGLSERRVGEALARWPGVRVSTKVGRLLEPDASVIDDRVRHGFRSAEPFAPVYDYSHDGILRSVEASLARLGVDGVDVLYIHDIGTVTHGSDNARHMTALTDGGGLAALATLKASGVTRAIGIGVNEVDACIEVMERAPLDVVLLAGRYTLLEQGALDRLFPRCIETGTAIVIGGPYNSGILATGTTAATPSYNYASANAATLERVRAIEAVCARHAVPLPAAALAFVRAHPAVVSVIPGLVGIDQVRATAESAAAIISDAFWEELRNAGLIRADAPTPPPAA